MPAPPHSRSSYSCSDCPDSFAAGCGRCEMRPGMLQVRTSISTCFAAIVATRADAYPTARLATSALFRAKVALPLSSTVVSILARLVRLVVVAYFRFRPPSPAPNPAQLPGRSTARLPTRALLRARLPQPFFLPPLSTITSGETQGHGQQFRVVLV